MKTIRPSYLRNSIFLGITLSIAAACGGDSGGEPTEGNSYLTVVGDTNVFIDYGVQRVLTVRYHDSDDNALAGEVGFAIRGTASGSTLADNSGVTNNQGMAEVVVRAGNDATAFTVEATAAYASPASWSVAVSAGTPPLSVVGSYNLSSKFDVASGLPGTLGDIVNTVIDFSDGPNDPATFILDIAEEELSSPFDDLLSAARPGLDAVVNDMIKENAPDIVNDLLEMANDLGEVSRNFGTNSIIAIVSDPIEGTGANGTHTMTGFHFTIDNQNYQFTNAELGVENVTVNGISVGMQNGLVNFSNHNMPIQYGGFLAMALEQVIIPAIDPNAANLEEFLLNRINCAAVGQAISDFIGIGSASLYEGVCIQGIAIGAELAISELIDIDDSAQVILQIAGQARVNDTTGDRKVDTMTQGKWAGAIEYLGESGALGTDSNVFTGARR